MVKALVYVDFLLIFKSFLWKQLEVFVLRSLNHDYIIGELNITQNQGIITCIPKDNKPKIFFKKLETVNSP